MLKQVVMSFDNYMKLCEMIEDIYCEVDKHNTSYFLANNVKEYELERPYVDDGSIYVCPECHTPIKLKNVDGGEVMEALEMVEQEPYCGPLDEDSQDRFEQNIKIIKKHILTTQQLKRELELYKKLVVITSNGVKLNLDTLIELKQLVGEDDE